MNHDQQCRPHGAFPRKEPWNLQIGTQRKSGPDSPNGIRFRRGVVLIVVLVLVVMVALAGFGFLASMSTEYQAARLAGDQRQSEQTMASAEALLLWLMEQPAARRNALGGIRNNPLLFRGRIVEPLVSQTELLSQNTGTATTGQEPDVRWRYSVVTSEVRPDQGTTLRFGLRDESTKLNLGSILLWDRQTPGTGRTALLQLPGMTEAVADALLDWIDPDDTVRELGAELDYYGQLDRPYVPSGKLPRTLEELLFVKGVSAERLLGRSTESANHSTSLTRMPSAPEPFETEAFVESSESAGLSQSATPANSWQEYLSLYSAERNRNAAGQNRIFLNGASLDELEQQLTGMISPDLLRFVLLARVYGLQRSAVDSGATPVGAPPASAPFQLSMAPAFAIPSVESLIGAEIRLPASSGAAGMVIASPLQPDSPDFMEQAERLFDLTSTTQNSVIPGRINILEADERVLRAIPSMSAEWASQIVAQRESLDPAERRSTLWLLTRKLLDVSDYVRLAPWMTAAGDVVSGEVIVFRAIGGPVLRRRIIIDGSGESARRLDWQDDSDSASPWPLRVLMPVDMDGQISSPGGEAEL